MSKKEEVFPVDDETIVDAAAEISSSINSVSYALRNSAIPLVLAFGFGGLALVAVWVGTWYAPEKHESTVVINRATEIIVPREEYRKLSDQNGQLKSQLTELETKYHVPIPDSAKTTNPVCTLHANYDGGWYTVCD